MSERRGRKQVLLLTAALVLAPAACTPPEKHLTKAELQSRRDALNLCYGRTVERTAWESPQYQQGLKDMQSCVTSLGFHVYIIDEPAEHKFRWEFDD